MRFCKGLCQYVKITYKQDRKIGYIPSVDRKYCAVCEYYLVSETVNCSCCRARLRLIPHYNRSRTKHTIMKVRI